MPPIRCTPGSMSRFMAVGQPGADEAESILVRFQIEWENLDEFLQLYRDSFWPVEEAIADAEHGRRTRVMVGDAGDDFIVSILYHYNSTDRGAFDALYESEFNTHLHQDDVNFHDKQSELLELVEHIETLRFGTAMRTG